MFVPKPSGKSSGFKKPLAMSLSRNSVNDLAPKLRMVNMASSPRLNISNTSPTLVIPVRLSEFYTLTYKSNCSIGVS